jgi:hypothetical protein
LCASEKDRTSREYAGYREGSPPREQQERAKATGMEGESRSGCLLYSPGFFSGRSTDRSVFVEGEARNDFSDKKTIDRNRWFEKQIWQ